MIWNRARADSTLPPGSRLLHEIDRVTSRPVVAWVLVVADAAWLIYSVVKGFPGRLETIFQSVVSALTLAMVFVLQHTQAREQLVTQRKLDEILRALPHADNSFIALEEASDHQLQSIHATQLDLRDDAVEDTPLP